LLVCRDLALVGSFVRQPGERWLLATVSSSEAAREAALEAAEIDDRSSDLHQVSAGSPRVSGQLVKGIGRRAGRRRREGTSEESSSR